MEQGAPNRQVLPQIRRSAIDGYDYDCIADIADTAEAYVAHAFKLGGNLTEALDRHIVARGNGKVEFMCGKCAVKCSLEKVDGDTTFLFENREDCAKNL